MKVAVFSTKSYDEEFLSDANARYGHELVFFEERLKAETVTLAAGHGAVCVFVNDQVNAAVVTGLARQGARVIALRCSGFNNVDLAAAAKQGVAVVRVPAYSPRAVAEHTVGLMLVLNRKIHRAYNRVREGNLSLDGLLGFEMDNKTVGVVGTGRIGAITAKILAGFGCRILAHDLYRNSEVEALGAEYVELGELFAQSDIITLHCPLTPETHHLVDREALRQMKPGVMLINTSRGAMIDTRAVIDGLKSGKIGYLGLDVYEEEGDLFFEDLSNRVITDDVFARLLTFPNVIVTGHQAFFTRTALENIADTTLANIAAIEKTGACANAVTAEVVRK